jgi:hypothetical protein
MFRCWERPVNSLPLRIVICSSIFFPDLKMGLACCRAIEDRDVILDGIEWKKEYVPQELKETPLGQCHVASSHHPYIGVLQIGGR